MRPSTLNRALADLAKAADVWASAVTDTRCGQCDTRVRRTAEEVRLYGAVLTWRAAAKEHPRFQSEAPTKKRNER